MTTRYYGPRIVHGVHLICDEHGISHMYQTKQEASLALQRHYADVRGMAPVEGAGGCMGVGSDRYPITVWRLVSAKTLEYGMDQYTALSDTSATENQHYVYTPVKDAVQTARLHKDGRWYTRGGSPLSIGHRSAYSDPSF